MGHNPCVKSLFVRHPKATAISSKQRIYFGFRTYGFGLFIVHLFLFLSAVESAMATACFWGRPFFISARMFSDMVLREQPCFNLFGAGCVAILFSLWQQCYHPNFDFYTGLFSASVPA
jgi:hypothetical protein